MVLTWPVTVMTDVMGVGVQVDLVGTLEVVDGFRGVGEVLEGGSDVLDSDVADSEAVDKVIGTGIKRVVAVAGGEFVVVSVVVSGVKIGV